MTKRLAFEEQTSGCAHRRATGITRTGAAVDGVWTASGGGLWGRVLPCFVTVSSLNFRRQPLKFLRCPATGLRGRVLPGFVTATGIHAHRRVVSPRPLAASWVSPGTGGAASGPCCARKSGPCKVRAGAAFGGVSCPRPRNRGREKRLQIAVEFGRENIWLRAGAALWRRLRRAREPGAQRAGPAHCVLKAIVEFRTFHHAGTGDAVTERAAPAPAECRPRHRAGPVPNPSNPGPDVCSVFSAWALILSASGRPTAGPKPKRDLAYIQGRTAAASGRARPCGGAIITCCFLFLPSKHCSFSRIIQPIVFCAFLTVVNFFSRSQCMGVCLLRVGPRHDALRYVLLRWNGFIHRLFCHKITDSILGPAFLSISTGRGRVTVARWARAVGPDPSR